MASEVRWTSVEAEPSAAKFELSYQEVPTIIGAIVTDMKSARSWRYWGRGQREPPLVL